MTKLEGHHRGAVVAAVASVIHRRSGHIDDHEGPVGGCYRAAEEVVDVVLLMLDQVDEAPPP